MLVNLDHCSQVPLQPQIVASYIDISMPLNSLFQTRVSITFKRRYNSPSSTASPIFLLFLLFLYIFSLHTFTFTATTFHFITDCKTTSKDSFWQPAQVYSPASDPSNSYNNISKETGKLSSLINASDSNHFRRQFISMISVVRSEVDCLFLCFRL